MISCLLAKEIKSTLNEAVDLMEDCADAIADHDMGNVEGWRHHVNQILNAIDMAEYEYVMKQVHTNE